jgi:hypothetical protein
MPCSLIQIVNSKKKGGHDSIKCFIAVLIPERLAVLCLHSDWIKLVL